MAVTPEQAKSAVSVRQEGNKLIVTVDMATFMSPVLYRIPIRDIKVTAEGTKVMVVAEIDEEELIKRAQLK